MLEREWESPGGEGRTHRVVREEVDGRTAVVLVDAPDGWWGVDAPPRVEVSSGR